MCIRDRPWAQEHSGCRGLQKGTPAPDARGQKPVLLSLARDRLAKHGPAVVVLGGRAGETPAMPSMWRQWRSRS
eukprot:12907156-Prorocentrum_lima.AAC.1